MTNLKKDTKIELMSVRAMGLIVLGFFICLPIFAFITLEYWEKNQQGEIECSTPSTHYNTENEFGIRAISRLSFIDDNTLQIEGWGSRTSLSVLTENPNPNLDPHGASHRVTYRRGQIDLVSGTSYSLTKPVYPLLLDPCSGSCSLEVTSQSPDDQWQLVQLYDSQPEFEGIWLVNSINMLKLLDFIPFWSTWQWLADDSRLWFQHSAPIYAEEAIMVLLTTPPAIMNNTVTKEDTLDPKYYHVAISSSELTTLSTTDPTWYDVPDNDELNVIDLDQMPPQRIVEYIPGIAKVEWNESTQSYLLVIQKEDVLVIREYESPVAVQLPLEAFKDYITVEALQFALPFRNYTLSQSGKSLAVEHSSFMILVFSCE